MKEYAKPKKTAVQLLVEDLKLDVRLPRVKLAVKKALALEREQIELAHFSAGTQLDPSDWYYDEVYGIGHA